MRLASRSSTVHPVSISRDSPEGDTISVDAPPSTSIQYIFRFLDWAESHPGAISNASTKIGSMILLRNLLFALSNSRLASDRPLIPEGSVGAAPPKVCEDDHARDCG